MTAPIKIIDAHAHLSEIRGAERKIRLAMVNGIVRIIAVGMHARSNTQTLALARIFPDTVQPALGYHPWMIDPAEDDAVFETIEKNIDHCIAIGEIGLDYKIDIPKDRQKAVFKRLLQLAAIAEKPVIVHSRYSDGRTFQMAVDAGIEKAVFHWYSGPLDLLDRIFTSGYYISATPALAYSRAHRAAIEKMPVERILIETDAPVEYQGMASEPMSLFTTLRALCELKGLTLSEAARITTENAERFFSLHRYGPIYSFTDQAGIY